MNTHTRINLNPEGADPWWHCKECITGWDKIHQGLAERDAAIDALVEALKSALPHITHVRPCYDRQRNGLDCACEAGSALELAGRALSPALVQQTAAQYRQAQAVVERVKDTRLLYAMLYGPDAVNDKQMGATEHFQKVLLGTEAKAVSDPLPLLAGTIRGEA